MYVSTLARTHTYTMLSHTQTHSSCAKLGVKDALCGQCEPLLYMHTYAHIYIHTFTHSSCAKLRVKDALCGQCEPLCETCDAKAGFKLINEDSGVRVHAYL